MFDIKQKKISWIGKELKLETGKIARQADGAVVVSYGGTKLLCTAVASRKAKAGQSFFPLTVNYQEKTFAAGKIPGGFFKREGRPTESETLISRLIDRSIRPLFPSNFLNETQVIISVLEYDSKTPSDILGVIGASAALSISGIPFDGPISCSRVGYLDDSYLLNPSFSQTQESSLDLMVSSSLEGILMVESQASEKSEDFMIEALELAFEENKLVNELILDFKKLVGEPKNEEIKLTEFALNDKLSKQISDVCEKKFAKAYEITSKQERSLELSKVRDLVDSEVLSKFEFVDEDEKLNTYANASKLTKALEAKIVREYMSKSKLRIDGRKFDQIRPIESEISLLTRTHGSALFTRGETQALAVATLGTTQDEQIIDSLNGEAREHFMLHYNFPPFSVNEASMLRSAGRREIGHGKLAWRALRPLMPTKEAFPYTIRVVAEICESNGSSSMATVCASSLALMDAGVPISTHCAGIAMGLIKEGEEFIVLSDILGDEDHLGDMDFKVAGTNKGVTSLQMDIKINSLTPQIIKEAIFQAKNGREHILAKMEKTINVAKESLSDFAPKIVSIKVPKDKIREVIGTGGKVIRSIIEESGAKIDIDDEGNVSIASAEQASIDLAKDKIMSVIAVPEEGAVYKGRVDNITNYGAFVSFLSNSSGLLHISEITQSRLETVEEVLSEGQMIFVEVLQTDNRGKIKLSMKNVDQNSGQVSKAKFHRKRN